MLGGLRCPSPNGFASQEASAGLAAARLSGRRPKWVSVGVGMRRRLPRPGASQATLRTGRSPRAPSGRPVRRRRRVRPAALPSRSRRTRCATHLPATSSSPAPMCGASFAARASPPGHDLARPEDRHVRRLRCGQPARSAACGCAAATGHAPRSQPPRSLDHPSQPSSKGAFASWPIRGQFHFALTQRSAGDPPNTLVP